MYYINQGKSKNKKIENRQKSKELPINLYDILKSKQGFY